MFGQSILFASVIGPVAGLIGGELALAATKALGGNDDVQRIAAKVGHLGSSLLAGWTVNALMGLDVTGAGAHTVVAAAGAEMHGGFRHPGGFEIFERARVA